MVLAKNKSIGFFLLFILTISGCILKKDSSSVSKTTSKKPNIIFILADDFGIMDIQAYANKFTGSSFSEMYYETPNINKLVAEGVSFSQAYATQLCSPTRASIITGKFASKLGITTALPKTATYYNQNLPIPNGYYVHDVIEHKDNIQIPQALINGISSAAIASGTPIDNGKNELSIAEVLPNYHSAYIGKWHLGGFGSKGYQPKDQGFISLAWFDAGSSSYVNWKDDWNQKSKGSFAKMPQDFLEIGNSGENTNQSYLTDDLTTQAVNFIDQRAKIKNEPFLLFFSHFAVHSPYQGKEDEINYFENKTTKGWNGHKDPIYASMIKSMDRSVGLILEKLKETGLEENTLVVFMSDNGGIDAKLTPNDKGTNNSPFLGGKACLTEGGIRVPLIFRWKGKIKNNWVDVPVDCTDILPTFAEVAGYNANKIVNQHKLDGQSIFNLFFDVTNTQKTYTKSTHYWHYPFNVIYNSPFEPYSLTPHSAIREGDYKLIFDWFGRLRLFNIQKDPFEQKDLSSELVAVKEALFQKLMNWLTINVDKRYWPKINPNYNATTELRNVPFKDLFSVYTNGSQTNKK